MKILYILVLSIPLMNGLVNNNTGACKCICEDPYLGIPVNCEWSSWSDWSSCSKSCGTGQRQKSRSIKINAKNGGVPCQGSYTQIDACTNRPCENDACCHFPFQQNGITWNKCMLKLWPPPGVPCPWDGSGKCFCASSVYQPGDRLYGKYPGANLKTYAYCDESCV